MNLFEGLENLPNVYFKSIEVYDYSLDSNTPVTVATNQIAVN